MPYSLKKAAKLMAENLETAIQITKNIARLDEILAAPVEEKYRTFVLEEKTQSCAEISPLEVTGTYHPDYQGMTWEKFLYKGKRMEANLQLLKHNPDYYITNGIKTPVMSYIRINNQLFIRDDGNHRTAIARLLFALIGDVNRPLKGVYLTEITIDRNLCHEYERFCKLVRALNPENSPLIRVFRKPIQRIDAVEVTDTAITRYEVCIEIAAKDQIYYIYQATSEKLRHFCKGVELYLDFLRKPVLKRFFSRKPKITPPDWEAFVKHII